jgi:hypothetical protein
MNALLTAISTPLVASLIVAARPRKPATNSVHGGARPLTDALASAPAAAFYGYGTMFFRAHELTASAALRPGLLGDLVSYTTA